MVEFLENSVCLKTVQTFLCHVGYRIFLLRHDGAVGSLGPALVSDVVILKNSLEFLGLSLRSGHCPPLEQVLSSDRLHSELGVYLLGFSHQLKM